MSAEHPEKLLSAEYLVNTSVQFTNQLRLHVPKDQDPSVVLYKAAEVLEVPGAISQFEGGQELQFWTPRTEFTTLPQPEGQGYTIDIYDQRFAASILARQQIEKATNIIAVAPSLVISLETTDAEATLQMLEGQEGISMTAQFDKQARHHDFVTNLLPAYREKCLSARRIEDLSDAWYSARHALHHAGIMEPRQLAEIFGTVSNKWLGHEGLAMSVDEKCLLLQRIASSDDIGPAVRRKLVQEFASTLHADMEGDVMIDRMWTLSAQDEAQPFVISLVCEGNGAYSRTIGQFAPRDFGTKLWLYAHVGDMLSTDIEQRNAMIAAAGARSGNHPYIQRAILQQFGCPVA